VSQWGIEGLRELLARELGESRTAWHRTLAENLTALDMLPLRQELDYLDDHYLAHKIAVETEIRKHRLSFEAVASKLRICASAHRRHVEKLEGQAAPEALIAFHRQQRDDSERKLAVLEEVDGDLARLLQFKEEPRSWPTPRRIREFTIADRTLEILRRVAGRCGVEPPQGFGTVEKTKQGLVVRSPIIRFALALLEELWPGGERQSAMTLLSNLKTTQAVIGGKPRGKRVRTVGKSR
jgi:hypothetical protein